MRKSPLLMAALLVMIAAPIQSAEVYKWVDENGVVHYEDRQPQGQQSEKMRVRAAPPGRERQAESKNSPEPESQAPASPEEQPGPEKQAEQAEAAPPEKDRKDPERCEKVRDNIRKLQENARVRIKGEDGQLRYLTQEEEEQKMEEYQKIAEEVCP